MFRSVCVKCGDRMFRRFACPRCGTGPLCSTCINNAAVDFSDGPDRPKAVLCCRACFVSGVSIDPAKAVDEYGPARGTAPTIVWVHGGGGSRAMYRTFAKYFSEHGYRCVLPDLPGHGSKLDDPLDIPSAVLWLEHVTTEYAPPFNGVRPIYVGGSLGGYIGMELLGRCPNLFSAAVIISATQTVGHGAGIKARLGLAAMRVMSRATMATTLVNAMLSVATKHKHLRQDIIRQDSYESGWYFQRATEQVDVLRQTDSQRALQAYHGPVLFLDGDQDYADQRSALVQIATANESSATDDKSPRLKPLGGFVAYPGGDHFFTHDDRFLETVQRDLRTFFDAVCQRAGRRSA